MKYRFVHLLFRNQSLITNPLLRAEISSRGPIACSMYGSWELTWFIFTKPLRCVTPALENYTGGIFQDTTGCDARMHDVAVSGYGTEHGTDYWVWIHLELPGPAAVVLTKSFAQIVRNSWGTYWGENGWFRIIAGLSFFVLSSFFAMHVAVGHSTTQPLNHNVQEWTTLALRPIASGQRLSCERRALNTAFLLETFLACVFFNVVMIRHPKYIYLTGAVDTTPFHSHSRQKPKSAFVIISVMWLFYILWCVRGRKQFHSLSLSHTLSLFLLVLFVLLSS